MHRLKLTPDRESLLKTGYSNKLWWLLPDLIINVHHSVATNTQFLIEMLE